MVRSTFVTLEQVSNIQSVVFLVQYHMFGQRLLGQQVLARVQR